MNPKDQEPRTPGLAATLRPLPPRRTDLDKARFFDDLGYRPHDGQRQVHDAAHRFRVVACGVRWGKTLLAAMEGLAAAMQPAARSIGWTVAPTYDLADRVFREVQLVAQTKLMHRVVAVKEAERRIILRNVGGGVSEVRAKSADNPVSLLGEGLHWVVVDEAARLKPDVWHRYVSQRLVDHQGWALLISTPSGKGYFHELYKRGQAGRDSEWRSWNWPSWTNPLLDPAVIERERQRTSERAFRQEYGAEFVEGTGAVFRGVREAATGQPADPIKDKDGRIQETYYSGLDLAKVEDFTVLVVMTRDGHVVHWDRFRRCDWAAQVQRVVAATERYPGPVLVDSTGVGDPIHESLRLAGVSARPYQFTQQSKAALIDNLAMMLERRQVVIPRPELWPELVDELESFQYSVSDAGNVRTGAPSGYHDDCVVALALAAWQVRPAKSQPRLVVLER